MMERLNRCRATTDRERAIALYGLEDIEANRLVVVLRPAPRPMHSSHKIRVKESDNPVWYQRMAGRRGFDKRGRAKRYGSLRVYVVRDLRRLIDGQFNPRALDGEILDEIESALENMAFQYGCNVEDILQASVKP